MQEPFPHVLQRASKENNWTLRFVTDEKVSDTIKEPMTIGGFISHKVGRITLARPAKGDWSKWPKHPTYYEAIGKG